MYNQYIDKQYKVTNRNYVEGLNYYAESTEMIVQEN